MKNLECPICESKDVKLNQDSELFCFTCFNLFSEDSFDKEMPLFPRNLERRKTRKKTKVSSNSSSNSNFLKKII